MKTRLVVIALFVCVFLACASTPQSVFGAAGGPSVAKWVRSDGRMDLESMRASGYQGPLDLEGYDVRLDRRSGEPMVRPSGARGVRENPDDQFWTEGFQIPGVDWRVNALTVYDNKVIAGGGFYSAGGERASGIAAWDGSAWLALGLGLEYGPDPVLTEVYALTPWRAELRRTTSPPGTDPPGRHSARG
jgi:hypothetical protein